MNNKRELMFVSLVRSATLSREFVLLDMMRPEGVSDVSMPSTAWTSPNGKHTKVHWHTKGSF
jgi:hypothetical protein